jgi:hypothetical protein
MNARDLSEPPITGRPRDAPLRRNTTITERFCTHNERTTENGAGQGVFGRVLLK